MSFQIPGSRLIEEILAGLPTNSRQAIQLREFAAQVESLNRENESLKAQIAALLPKHEMQADTAKVLKYYFETDGRISGEQIAAKFDFKGSVAKYHLGVLQEKGFISVAGMVIHEGYPIYYIITQEGRDFIVKNGMA